MIGSWDLYLKSLCNYSKVGSNLNGSQSNFTSEAMLVEGAIDFLFLLNLHVQRGEDACIERNSLF